MYKFILILVPVFFINCNNSQTLNENEIQEVAKTEKFMEYHPNGKIKIQGDIVKGIRQNTWKSFYENGNNWSETTYLFGARNGIYKLFYPNGNLKVHGVYENDKKIGIWYFYNENGQFEKELDYNQTEVNESN